MDAQLQRLIELQTKQNQLLERYLWRIRFSLITLLLLTTAICCCLGFIIYEQQTNPGAVPKVMKTITTAPPNDRLSAQPTAPISVGDRACVLKSQSGSCL